MTMSTSAQAYSDDAKAVRRRTLSPQDATTICYLDNPAFSKHFRKLAEIKDTHVEGRECPSHIATVWARLILEHLCSVDFEPTRIAASADGGITICFIRGDVYCDLECLNNGEVLGVTTNRLDRPTVWTVGSGLGAVSGSVDRIREFLHSHEAKENAPKRPWYRFWF